MAFGLPRKLKGVRPSRSSSSSPSSRAQAAQPAGAQSGPRITGESRPLTGQEFDDRQPSRSDPNRNPFSEAVQGVGDAASGIAQGVGDAASFAGNAVGGVLGGVFGSQPLPTFPSFQVDPIAQHNFQSLVNAPAIQPQQVQGFGSIAGQVPTVTPQQIQAAQLATGGIEAARGLGLNTRLQQQQAIGGLQRAAAGQVPSAAEIQSGQALDSALRQQLALASSARGGAAAQAAAQRQAQAGIGQLQQGAIADTAALRAQEQAAARQALAGTLAGVRGQDLGLQQVSLQQAGAQAQLGQQAALANQGAALQGGIANQGAVLSALQADQANQFRVESANQQAGLQAAGLDIQRQLGGAQGVLGAQQLQAQAFQHPLGLRAQVDAAERARQAQFQGSIIQGLAGAGTKLLGLG